MPRQPEIQEHVLEASNLISEKLEEMDCNETKEEVQKQYSTWLQTSRYLIGLLEK